LGALAHSPYDGVDFPDSTSLVFSLSNILDKVGVLRVPRGKGHMRAWIVSRKKSRTGATSKQFRLEM
jgi:hypothetical protein